VVLLGAGGTVLHLNPKAAAWWGIAPTDAQGKLLAEVGRGTLPELLYEALHRAAAGEQLPSEYYLPVADQWLAMASRPHPEGVAIHWQAVTAQKQRPHQYQTLAETPPDAHQTLAETTPAALTRRNRSDVQRLEAENRALKLNQQQELLLAILQAQETERTHLAEGLHNGLGQLLYAIKLQIGQLDVPALHALPALNEVRTYANRLLAEAISQTRTLSHALLPTMLTEQGLGPALRDICRSLTTTQFQFACHVWLDEQVLSPPLQTAVYRLAQELAHNIAKHAGATQATLEFEMLPGWVSLRAEDNGRGFDPLATAKGLGMSMMHDAVDLLGGTMHLTSSPSCGTHIRLRIPFIPEKVS